uniref:2,4-dihydroxyhept-2-ene-1,7-dioic acid aldolase n=1 Tax=Mycena chlorophos TaxID=658473 RepID=A0ABQ0KYL6_MYCCL|nr:2,4-dihydroxyhept-2-ene-1,7-dioic acid aldolase [Mycena chlorophos]
MVPIVRVPSKTAFDYMVSGSEHLAGSNSNGPFKAWCLDAGAGGIIIPHIETVEEVKEVIGACRFPPIGHRSFPPFTFINGVTDHTPEGKTIFSLANEHVAIIPQVESRVGIANLEEIASMKEITAMMIGAGDLRLDMGLPLAMVGDEPEFVAAMEKATAMSKKYKLPLVGLAIGPEMLLERIDAGFTVLSVASDFHTLAYGLLQGVGTAKASAEQYLAQKRAA